MSPTDTNARPVTAWHHTRAIVALPIMNTVAIPAVIVYTAGDLDPSGLEGAGPAPVFAAMLGVTAVILGVALVVRCIAVLANCGRGTLAPWDPTRTLVVGDVYRYCRNPMKLGLFLILIGEAAALRSVALAAWCALFALINVVYIHRFEEPTLRARFGSAYDTYCAAVSRWRPRMTSGSNRSLQGGTQ